MNKTWSKWMPAVAVPVLIASAAVAVPMAANADVNLPNKTPAEVLALVGTSKAPTLSGTVTQSSNLGLPQLPSSGAGSDSGVSSALGLLTGSYDARVYIDGRTRARVQVMDRLAERDVVRNGNDVWLYNSRQNTVVHSTLPARAAKAPAVARYTPSTIAKRLLAGLRSSSDVRVGADLQVAGRAAYDLILTPKATDTLLKSVDVAVDGATGLPLRVQVTARGQKAPAYSLGFTTLSLAKSDPKLFSFTPPAGATVTEHKLPVRGHLHGEKGIHGKKGVAGQKDAHGRKSGVTVIGSGWDAVVSVKASASTAKLSSSPQFRELSTAVTGGRVFSTALVTVLVTDDGRVFAGSVSQARLTDLAAHR